MEKLKRTWVEINLDNLRYNCAQLKGMLKDGVALMAVVKADAYGHGDVEVANAISEFSDWFAVSNLMEAKRLRKAGIEKPILILGYTPVENCSDLSEMGITQTVLGPDYAEELSAAAADAGIAVDVHIKVDTGMSRIGFAACEPEECVRQIEKAVSLPGLNTTGIFTHFAVADEDSDESKAFTLLQHDRFSDVIWELNKRGVDFERVHCCNSAAMIFIPSYHHTMVRPGIVLYGCSPSGKPIEEVDLRPVMTLKTTVSLVKDLHPGETVGYGRKFRCEKDMKVATVAIGYADGYPRVLSNRGYAFVNDTVVPIIGNICMDQMMLDVTSAEVHEGDQVILFGEKCPIGVDNVAALAGTINYEILCGISRRVERVYIRDGKEVSVVDYTT